MNLLRSPYAIALLAATVVFLTSNTRLLSGAAVPQWDASVFFAPAQSLVADHAREGRLLLWNPWLSAGRPDCADPQVGAFSPINVGLGLLTGGGLAGFVAYWLTIWWLGGLGVLLLARRLGAPAWGGFVAAVAYMGSGIYTGHAQHTSVVVVASLLPFVVERLDAALTSDEHVLKAAQAGALWGLSALSGYPGLVISTVLFAGLCSLGRVITSPAAKQLRRSIVIGLVFLAVGLVVLAPTYAAFVVEGGAATDRAEPLSRESAVTSNALDPGALATVVSPYLATVKLLNPSLWPETDASMTSLYTSAPVLVLAVLALLARPRERWRLWLAGCGLFFLAATMGRDLPLRGWLYDMLSPMRYFRHAAMLRLFYILPLVVLAIYASRDLATASRDALRRSWTHASLVALLGGGATLAVMSGLASQVEAPARLAQATWIAAAIWIGVAAVAAWGHKARTTWVVAGWVLLVVVDAASSSVLSRWLVQSPATAAWHDASAGYRASIDPGGATWNRLPVSPFGDEPNNLNLVTKQPVLDSVEPFRNPYLDRWTENPRLAGVATGRDRIWFASRAQYEELDPEAMARFEQGATATLPLVLHSAAPGAVDGEDLRPVAVDWRETSPTRLHFSLRVPEDGWIFLTERHAPGWRAWVNGAEVPVQRAGFIFRAVAVAAGENELRWQYTPWGYPALLILSWATMAGVVVASLRRRKEAGT